MRGVPGAIVWSFILILSVFFALAGAAVALALLGTIVDAIRGAVS